MTERSSASDIETGERVVWKYQLDFDGKADLHVGADARVVHIAADPTGNYMAVVWVEHTLDGSSLILPLIIHGTGHPITKNAFHVGTVVTPSGFVWHVYRRNS